MKHLINLIITLTVLQMFLFVIPQSPTYAQSEQSERCVTKVGDPDPDTSPSPGPLGCTKVGGSGVCQSPPDYPADLASAIKVKFGITILGMGEQQLKWVWEEFWAIGCTPFLREIDGAIVQSYYRADYVSYMDSCPTDGAPDVYFNNVYDEQSTKGLIVHELAHVWQICSPNGTTNLSEMPAVRAEDGGGLTNYGKTGCGFDINIYNEDHAETITFHLNPTMGEITCGGGRPNPYLNGAYPAHKRLAIKGVGPFGN